MLRYGVAISVTLADMPLARILVVDDEPLNLDIIKAFLSDENYELSLFENSSKAWEHLCDQSSHFDLVLLDRMMPGLDGIEFLSRIKSNEHLKSLPVILQTAANSPDQVAKGLEAGAYYYLTKPYEPNALLSIVRAAVAEVRQHKYLNVALARQSVADNPSQTSYFVFRTVQEIPMLAAIISRQSAQPQQAIIGLSELLCNAVEHGNLGISYAEKSALKHNNLWDTEILQRQQLPQYKNKTVKVNVSHEGEMLHVLITDEGQGFDWQPYMEIAPERAFDPNGRGIALANKISFVRIQYHGKGNAVSAYLKAKYSTAICNQVASGVSQNV